MAKETAERQRKVLSLNTQLLAGLHLYARESGERLEDLYDEALRDLMKKKGQPVTLMQALKESTRAQAANEDKPHPRPSRAGRKRR